MKRLFLRLLANRLLWGAVWLCAVGVGMTQLWSYSLTAGPRACPASDWPAPSRIPRAPDMPTLVVFVHPQCACTRATLGELAVILSRAESPVDVRVLVLAAPGSSAHRAAGGALQDLRGYANVTIGTDEEGREARLFHAATSGETLFFDAGGRLRFHGGITGARGHLGDNDGREAILSLLGKNSAERAETPTFGCVLFSETGS